MSWYRYEVSSDALAQGVHNLPHRGPAARGVIEVLDADVVVAFLRHGAASQ